MKPKLEKPQVIAKRIVDAYVADAVRSGHEFTWEKHDDRLISAIAQAIADGRAEASR